MAWEKPGTSHVGVGAGPKGKGRPAGMWVCRVQSHRGGVAEPCRDRIWVACQGATCLLVLLCCEEL